MNTHTIVILDSSGSMEPLTDDTIGGYNRFLTEQRSVAQPGDTWTLTVFNNASETRLARIPIGEVPRLSPESYRPMGGTALLDAVTDSIRAFDTPTDDRVLCVVQTDGEENASTRTTLAEVQDLVKERERSGAWTFVFMGAGIDAFHSGASIGSAAAKANSLSYAASPAGTQGAWAQLSRSSVSYRKASRRASADFFAADQQPPAAADKPEAP